MIEQLIAAVENNRVTVCGEALLEYRNGRIGNFQME
jgi:hypothetical protein